MKKILSVLFCIIALIVVGYIWLLLLQWYVYSQALTRQYGSLETIDGVYIPKDMNDALSELDKKLDNQAKERFKNLNEKDLTIEHFGLGLWMRNNWGLWKHSRLAQYFYTKGILHPDDMSGVMLDCYHQKLNQKTCDLLKK